MNRPLHYAFIHGRVDAVKLLLEHGAYTYRRDAIGRNYLHETAESGHIEMMKLFIDAGTDVNAITAYSNNTPLHYAAYMGNIDAVRLLIDHGANINQKDDKSRTPLDDALRCNKTDVVELLKSHGAT